jgi:hypothetical protein
VNTSASLTLCIAFFSGPSHTLSDSWQLMIKHCHTLYEWLYDSLETLVGSTLVVVELHILEGGEHRINHNCISLGTRVIDCFACRDRDNVWFAILRQEGISIWKNLKKRCCITTFTAFWRKMSYCFRIASWSSVLGALNKVIRRTFFVAIVE